MRLPSQAANAYSLSSHMAYAALLSGKGNIDQVGNLLRTVYMTFFMREKYGLSRETVFNAEYLLNMSMASAENLDEITLTRDEADCIEAVLAVYDKQLACECRGKLEASEQRVIQLVSNHLGTLMTSDAGSALHSAQEPLSVHVMSRLA